LEANRVTANGFAFSLMTEFIENSNPQASKQDCELKAFYRLAERLKPRFPRLPICLLLDGLFAGGPTFQRCEDYNWRYLIVLQDQDLFNVNRSYHTVLPLVPENHKRLRLGPQLEKVQDFRWVKHLAYTDSQGRSHNLNRIVCQETQPPRRSQHHHLQGIDPFHPCSKQCRCLGQPGRSFTLENRERRLQHSEKGRLPARTPLRPGGYRPQGFLLLAPIAHLIFQLIEKGSLFRKAFPNGLGSLQNIACRLLEAWRNLRLSTTAFQHRYNGRYQIRFDSS
jgi:hypothetical protein